MPRCPARPSMRMSGRNHAGTIRTANPTRAPKISEMTAPTITTGRAVTSIAGRKAPGSPTRVTLSTTSGVTATAATIPNAAPANPPTPAAQRSRSETGAATRSSSSSTIGSHRGGYQRRSRRGCSRRCLRHRLGGGRRFWGGRLIGRCLRFTLGLWLRPRLGRPRLGGSGRARHRTAARPCRQNLVDGGPRCLGPGGRRALHDRLGCIERSRRRLEVLAHRRGA